jgi:hypothetical protein
MFDDAVISAAVAIHVVTVVARLFAYHHAITAYSVALTRIQTGKTGFDLTRVRASVPIENIIVVALLARHLDAIATDTDTDAGPHFRLRSVCTTHPARFDNTAAAAAVHRIRVVVVAPLSENPPTIATDGVTTSAIKPILFVVATVESNFQLAQRGATIARGFGPCAVITLLHARHEHSIAANRAAEVTLRARLVKAIPTALDFAVGAASVSGNEVCIVALLLQRSVSISTRTGAYICNATFKVRNVVHIHQDRDGGSPASEDEVTNLLALANRWLAHGRPAQIRLAETVCTCIAGLRCR